MNEEPLVDDQLVIETEVPDADPVEQETVDEQVEETSEPEGEPTPEPESKAKAPAVESKFVAPKQQAKLEAPNPDDFDAGIYDPEYLMALTDYKVEQKFEQQRLDASNATKQSAVVTQQEAARQAYSDYDAVEQSFLSHPLTAVPEFQSMLFESENPVELAYYLGTNQAELNKISDMTALQAARYLGNLEAKLTPKKAESAQKPLVPNAPKPISPIGGKGRTVVTNINDARTMEEYVRLRTAK